MHGFRRFSFLILASVFLAAAAHADDMNPRSAPGSIRVVYRGKSSQGAVYQGKDSGGRTLFVLTITDAKAIASGGSSAAAGHHPRPDWSALIGTGGAAAAEEKR
jgi:hypothetical protein